jgi:hypothetical protein
MRCETQRRQVLPTPLIHPHLAPLVALPVANEQRAAALIEVRLRERQRLLDAQPRAPQDDDQGAYPVAVHPVAGLAHDGDDFLHPRRVGRIAPSLVARHAARQISRHRRRRAAPTSSIERGL